MFIYAATVLAILFLSSLILIYFPKKKNILNLRLIIIIDICALIISLITPFLIASLVATYFEGENQAQFWFNALIVLMVIAFIYLILIFLFTMLTSMVVDDKKTMGFIEKLSKIKIIKKSILEKSVDSTVNIDKMRVEVLDNQDDFVEDSEISLKEADLKEFDSTKTFGEVAVSSNAKQAGEISSDNIDFGIEYFDKFVPELEAETIEESNKLKGMDGEAIDMNNNHGAKLSEKSAEVADSYDYVIGTEGSREENSQYVMVKGVQTENENDTESFLSEYIEEAFKLKETGDLEGAILYYMYALDTKPLNDIAFLIVLDTCALYKELGQIELAKNILEGYYKSFGDEMDASVKAEIERNFY